MRIKTDPMYYLNLSSTIWRPIILWIIQRFTLRGAIDQRFRDKDQMKKEAEQNFQLFRTGLLDSDREYIDKLKVGQTHPDFMTDQDLIAERTKLISSMANLITAELDIRSFISEDTKVAMKYVLMSIVKMDNIAEDESYPLLHIF